MNVITEQQSFAVIDYLMNEWTAVQRRTEQSIRAPKIVILSLSDLEEKGVPIDDARTLFSFLYERGCFSFQNEKHFKNFKRMAAIDETEEDCNAEPMKGCMLSLEDINCVKLFGIRLEAEGKKGLPIIKLIALEHIARKMAETDPAKNLIKMLRNCNLPFYLYLTPNNKGRMLIDFFHILAASTDMSQHQLLFRIFEEFCHPLHFGGSKERAQEMQDFFSDLLEYDSMYFEDYR